MFGGGKKEEEENEEEVEEGEEEQPQEKEKKSVCSMKRGDYMIHVMIETAKNLDIPEGDVIDPIVEVTCLGESKFTKALDDINNTGLAIWNEHIFFEPKNVEVDRLEKGKIEILQMNIGLYCNQACNHCHVESSPKRSEMMTEDIARRCMHLMEQTPS